jgi:ATP-binding cassette subfamily C (CFTR/MRP) protein 4
MHLICHLIRSIFSIQLRLGLVAAIYAKTLRLPSVGGANSVTSGHLTNLASNDVERFLSISVTSVFLLLGPFEAIAILIVGISVIGPAFAVGYGLLFLLLPLQMYLSRRFVQFRSQVAAITDNRVSLVSQAVSGVRVMKLNGWELEFNKRISKTRSEEVAKLQNASRFKALNEACYYFTSLAVSVFIFTVHILMGGSLTPRNVFTTMTLLNIVQFTLTKHVPNAVMGLSECYVSCKRIQAFFELPERIVSTSIESETTVGQEDAVGSREVLSLSGVTCYWNVNCKPTSDHRPLIRKALTLSSSSTDKLNDPESLKVALSDISLTFKSKELYCIIGKVGSGKSALLQTLAEELPVSDGQVTRNYHSLSYATQDPWIMDGSVRENIVMGLPFNEDWYRKVLEACGLVPDIADFSYGDLTVVGDRGVQCSGGQKARIGLARALYRDSEVLILDDPLSAVDSKVARSIYYSAIHDLAIKRGKCVVLVTHQHQFVGNAACCILLDSGKVVCCGTFADSVACSNGDLSDALQIEKESHSSESTSQKNPPHLIDTPLGLLDRTDESNAIQDVAQSEKRDTGIIRLATWSAYGKALGGMIVCTLFFFLFSATQACLLVTIVTVGYWAEASASEQVGFSLLAVFQEMHKY